MEPNIPAFGSEPWLRHQLLGVLRRVREAVNECHKKVQETPQKSVDYDHYAFAHVALKQRKVWAVLLSLATEHEWISASSNSSVLDISPSIPVDGMYSKSAEGCVARAIVDILKQEGIEARLEERWRREECAPTTRSTGRSSPYGLGTSVNAGVRGAYLAPVCLFSLVRRAR